MSEVLKVHTGLSIQSNITHVEGVKSSSIYTIRAVMFFYVKDVERSSKWFYTSLLITFLIFNGFPIQKKFWKAENKGFSNVELLDCTESPQKHFTEYQLLNGGRTSNPAYEHSHHIRVFHKSTNWKYCHYCQLCIPIYLQFSSLLATHDVSKCEIRSQWM